MCVGGGGRFRLRGLCPCCKIHRGDYVHVVKIMGGDYVHVAKFMGGGGLCPRIQILAGGGCPGGGGGGGDIVLH